MKKEINNINNNNNSKKPGHSKALSQYQMI